MRGTVERMDADTEAARKDGYNAALNDCLGLLRKWFWASNREARACEADIRKLEKK